jgi:Uma2 family endonuclease
MATVETSAVVESGNVATIPRIPELRAGDRLSRAEFERRYSAMPNVKKAELIEGVVYMPSPVSSVEHGNPHFDLVTFLGFYRVATPGIEGSDNATVRLDGENEPQPDAYLRIVPQFGGQTRDDGKYVAGAPELVAEIAASSVSYDLHDKLRSYQRNGVREYLVWRVWDSAIDWFVLRDGRFERMSPVDSGHYQSAVFPGLWLDLDALLRGDVLRVLTVLQQGIVSPEHATFVAQLQSAQAKSAAT